MDEDDVIAEFKKRWIREVVGLVVLIAILLSSSLLESLFQRLNFPSNTTTTVIVIAIVGYAIFTYVNWRCPACNEYFYREIYPRYCPQCGAALRD